MPGCVHRLVCSQDSVFTDSLFTGWKHCATFCAATFCTIHPIGTWCHPSCSNPVGPFTDSLFTGWKHCATFCATQTIWRIESREIDGPNTGKADNRRKEKCG